MRQEMLLSKISKTTNGIPYLKSAFELRKHTYNTRKSGASKHRSDVTSNLINLEMTTHIRNAAAIQV